MIGAVGPDREECAEMVDDIHQAIYRFDTQASNGLGTIMRHFEQLLTERDEAREQRDSLSADVVIKLNECWEKIQQLRRDLEAAESCAEQWQECAERYDSDGEAEWEEQQARDEELRRTVGIAQHNWRAAYQYKRELEAIEPRLSAVERRLNMNCGTEPPW